MQIQYKKNAIILKIKRKNNKFTRPATDELQDQKL